MLWETATGALQRTLNHSGKVISVTFSPDGRLLASVSEDSQALGDGNWRTTAHDRSARRRYDNGRATAAYKRHDNTVSSIAFSPNEQLLASSFPEDMIKLWKTAIGALQHTVEGPRERGPSVAFSPDGQLLASASWDNTIKLWKTATSKLEQTLKGHTSLVRSVAFSPDGRLLASASWDHTVKLWETATGMLQQTLKATGSIEYLRFSKSRRCLETNVGSYDILPFYELSTDQLAQISIQTLDQ
ncbi:hypothetical protein N7490_001378 [Penicillium lividum]|nr:hypothetical protein N7490_001378 [Penicillium lividum]